MSNARIFALAVLAAATFAAISPGAALAQHPVLQEPNAAAETTISQQLTRLSDRVDRYVAQGRLSKVDAVDLHRKINNIEGAASADRETHGGKLSMGDRFELDTQISDLKADLRRRLTAPAAHTGR